MITHNRYLQILAGIYLVVWTSLAIDPSYRADWLLENLLVIVFAVVMIATHRHFVWSRISYTLIFVFMCLHSIGSHYTYAEVPYDAWFNAVAGTTLNEVMDWERNHFDRLVHFCYGLLLAYPIREVCLRVVQVRGFWGYFLPLDITMSTSMLYELIEWGAAEVFGGDLGMTFLGSQGDVWDGHRDMALASLGALLAMGITAAINARLKRDFAQEWVHSLEVKDDRPLGEDAIARMLAERGDE